MNIGKRIKLLRVGMGLTQSDLAEKAGLSRTAVWNYENDKRVPSVEILDRIATTLNVKPTEFISSEPDTEIVNIAVSGLKGIEEMKEPQRTEELEKAARTVLEWKDSDIARILKYKENANLNGHLLSDEERRQILTILEVLFPTYIEGA